jgi:hypothetical protein
MRMTRNVKIRLPRLLGFDKSGAGMWGVKKPAGGTKPVGAVKPPPPPA